MVDDWREFVRAWERTVCCALYVVCMMVKESNTQRVLSLFSLFTIAPIRPSSFRRLPTTTPSTFRFQFDFRHIRLPTFNVFCVQSYRATDDDDGDDDDDVNHKSVSIYECTGNSVIDGTQNERTNERSEAKGTKENTKKIKDGNSDGIIFITILCYQVKEQSTHSHSFRLNFAIGSRWQSGDGSSDGGEGSFGVCFSFASMIMRHSIYFASNRDGWLTGANTLFGFRLYRVVYNDVVDFVRFIRFVRIVFFSSSFVSSLFAFDFSTGITLNHPTLSSTYTQSANM